MIRRSIRRPLSAQPGESGATLVELLLAVAVSAMVLTMLGTAVFQFFTISNWGQARLSVLKDLQTAGLWLGRDAQEASSFVPGVGTVYGTFRWSDASIEFRYSYSAADQALVREAIAGSIVQSTLTVARHIASQGDVTFSPSGKRVAVTLTATSGTVTASNDLTLTMRVP
jgi:hypothetical protein